MSAPRPPFLLRVRREPVYAAIVVAFLFGTAELVLRVKHAAVSARRGERPYSIRSVNSEGIAYAHEDGRIALVADPHLVYRTQPDQSGPVVNVNGDGFRGAPWRHEKAAGTTRVIVVGGSAAFGVGASGDGKLFTVAIEAALDERARARAGAPAGARAEVWNAGVVGYDSTQELVLLATRLIDLAPDVVVVFDGWNDFNASATLPERMVELLHPKFCEVDALLGRRSQLGLEFLRQLDLYQSIESGLERWRRKLQPAASAPTYTDRSDRACPRYERNLRAMIRLCRGFGATPLIASQPELFQRSNPPPGEQALRRGREGDGYGAYARAAYPRFVASARAVAEAEQAAWVDCTPIFDSLPDEIFTDCVHFNDRGNELLARFLTPAIERALRW